MWRELLCFSQVSTVTFMEYVLNKEFTESQFRAEFGPEAEYPQISIGVHHRGSLKETLHYLKDNELIT